MRVSSREQFESSPNSSFLPPCHLLQGKGRTRARAEPSDRPPSRGSTPRLERVPARARAREREWSSGGWGSRRRESSSSSSSRSSSSRSSRSSSRIDEESKTFSLLETGRDETRGPHEQSAVLLSQASTKVPAEVRALAPSHRGRRCKDRERLKILLSHSSRVC